MAKPCTPHPIPQAAQLFELQSRNVGGRGGLPSPFSGGFKGGILFGKRIPPLVPRRARRSPSRARAGKSGHPFGKGCKKDPPHHAGAHKKVIEEITIMASVRRDWQRNNGYLVRAGYPLFFCRHEKQWIYSQLSGIIALNQSYPIHSKIFSKNLEKVWKHWNNSAVLMPYIVEG